MARPGRGERVCRPGPAGRWLSDMRLGLVTGGAWAGLPRGTVGKTPASLSGQLAVPTLSTYGTPRSS